MESQVTGQLGAVMSEKGAQRGRWSTSLQKIQRHQRLQVLQNMTPEVKLDLPDLCSPVYARVWFSSMFWVQVKRVVD